MSYINLFTESTITSSSSLKMNGGKGLNLIKMKRSGLNVPSGLVITTEACNAYRKISNPIKKKLFMTDLMSDVSDNLQKVYKDSPHKILSVRSGAAISMAGMMDTILNVGVGFEGHGLESPHLEKDCIKRFVTMFVPTVTNDKASVGELSEDDINRYFKSITNHSESVLDVIELSIIAVFNSWDSERAKHYRKMYNISDKLGTAVVIQSMVFGNYNDNSGSGVMFTRNPNTGKNTCMGEFLVNCQGEDVVSGDTTPIPIANMTKWNSKVYSELKNIGKKLEIDNKDMQDIEFTVQDGELFILQTRSGKRSPQAEVKIALDFVNEGIINSLSDHIHKGTFNNLTVPTLPPAFKSKVFAKGIASGGYLATGRAAYSVAEVLSSKEPTILVSKETTPEDIKGMEHAVGLLTETGGATSHAAVVARGMNKPCVVGCSGISVLLDTPKPKYLLIDGQTGNVYLSHTPFNIDLKPTLPIDLIKPIIEGIDCTNKWVQVSDVTEAMALQDHIYNVVIPYTNLVDNEITSLSVKFNNVVLITPERVDTVSAFLGGHASTDVCTFNTLPTVLDKLEINNMFLHTTRDIGYALHSYKTMADVMNPDFIGVASPEFIEDVMGGGDTFNDIIEQLDMQVRIVDTKTVAALLELFVSMG